MRFAILVFPAPENSIHCPAKDGEQSHCQIEDKKCWPDYPDDFPEWCPLMFVEVGRRNA